MCCISILTGLPTLLGEITCVSCIISLTGLLTLLGEADVCLYHGFNGSVEFTRRNLMCELFIIKHDS